jgi:hypothetical protein
MNTQMTRYERAESAAKMLIDALRAMYTTDTGVTPPPPNSSRGVAGVESDGNNEYIYIGFGYATSSNRVYVTLKAGMYNARESRFEVKADGVNRAGFLATFERLVREARARNADYARVQRRVKDEAEIEAESAEVLRAVAAANGWTLHTDADGEGLHVELPHGLQLTPSNHSPARVCVRLGSAYNAPVLIHSTPDALLAFLPAFDAFKNQ